MKLLNKEELDVFADKYFKSFKQDIYSVSVVEYKDTYEYLVNRHYLFVVNKESV